MQLCYNIGTSVEITTLHLDSDTKHAMNHYSMLDNKLTAQ